MLPRKSVFASQSVMLQSCVSFEQLDLQSSMDAVSCLSTSNLLPPSTVITCCTIVHFSKMWLFFDSRRLPTPILSLAVFCAWLLTHPVPLPSHGCEPLATALKEGRTDSTNLSGASSIKWVWSSFSLIRCCHGLSEHLNAKMILSSGMGFLFCCCLNCRQFTMFFLLNRWSPSQLTWSPETLILNGACTYYVMVSKVERKPFLLATQQSQLCTMARCTSTKWLDWVA